MDFYSLFAFHGLPPIFSFFDRVQFQLPLTSNVNSSDLSMKQLLLVLARIPVVHFDCLGRECYRAINLKK